MFAPIREVAASMLSLPAIYYASSVEAGAWQLCLCFGDVGRVCGGELRLSYIVAILRGAYVWWGA